MSLTSLARMIFIGAWHRAVDLGVHHTVGAALIVITTSCELQKR